MVNIRQSKEYALFMEKLGWKIEKIFNYVYIRQFPLIGSFIKILRIRPPIPFKEIEKIAKKYRAFKVQIELDQIVRHSGERSDSRIRFWTSPSTPSSGPRGQNDENYGYQLAKTSFVPTKTIMIDLKPTEEQIFNSFSPEKRRAVRRAEKNGIIIKEADYINEFIKLKNQQLWPFGFLLKNEIKKLWEVFKHTGKTVLLLAYKNNITMSLRGASETSDEAISETKAMRLPRSSGFAGLARNDREVLAGVLLMFHDQTAYYWLASSTKEGKKLFAPSLLVWEALKLSKKNGCTLFDFEGVEDTRFPETKSWSGFTKFKNGFGGKEIIFVNPIEKHWLPFL